MPRHVLLAPSYSQASRIRNCGCQSYDWPMGTQREAFPKSRVRLTTAERALHQPRLVSALGPAPSSKGRVTLDKCLELSVPGSVWLSDWVNSPQPAGCSEMDQERPRRASSSMPGPYELEVCHLGKSRRIKA